MSGASSLRCTHVIKERGLHMSVYTNTLRIADLTTPYDGRRVICASQDPCKPCYAIFHGLPTNAMQSKCACSHQSPRQSSSVAPHGTLRRGPAGFCRSSAIPSCLNNSAMQKNIPPLFPSRLENYIKIGMIRKPPLSSRMSFTATFKRRTAGSRRASFLAILPGL